MSLSPIPPHEGINTIKRFDLSIVLHNADIYYHLKKNNLRDFERTEEQFLIQLLLQEKGCKISEFYLETGIHPVRFEIIKMILLYLNENKNSVLYRFFTLQYEQSTRGSWAHQALCDLEYLEINIPLLEITSLSILRSKRFISLILL